MDHAPAQNQKYIFSTPALWRKGNNSSRSGLLRGTLGLTASGRVEFTLDQGKLLFSAPVSLTKRKYESTFGWLRFVVASKRYTLQFYAEKAMAATYSAFVGVAEARLGDAAFSEWRKLLEQHAASPDDGRPVIVAATPPALEEKTKKYARSGAMQMLAILLGVALIAFIAFNASKMLGLPPETETPVSYLILIVLIFGLMALIALSNKKRRQSIEEPLPPEQLVTQPGETLPAGTPPSIGFGLTFGHLFLIGLLIVPALLFVAVALEGVILGISKSLNN